MYVCIYILSTVKSKKVDIKKFNLHKVGKIIINILMNWVNLFYDKYAGDHHYKNKITKQVSIADLEDGSFMMYVGDKALKIYNSKFDSNFSIPVKLLNSDLYQLRIFTKVVNKLECVYTVISVNSSLLEQYIRSKIEIPETVFLKSLCRFHKSYIENESNNCNYSTYQINETVTKNSTYIAEKAIECVDYKNDNQIDSVKELTVELFDFQKCSIHWMIEKENNPATISYNLYDEVIIGDTYFDMYKQSFNLAENRNKLTFYGGALIDEVGMGKTIQMITLGLKNKVKKDPVKPKTPFSLQSDATVIICPNQLCGQWLREFKDKVNKENCPEIIMFLTKRDHDKYTYKDVLNADVVIISYTFLDNKSFVDPWTSKLSTSKSYHRQNWDSMIIDKVSTQFKKFEDELLKDSNTTLKMNRVQFQLIKWNRICVDEFHEVYSVVKYSYVRNILPFFKANYKWIITATPFIKNSSMISMVDFLTDYKNKDSDRVLTNDNIVDYLSYNCFRRNTKKSVEEIEKFKLPPIEEEVHWLKFSTTERMMYNAYLANPTNDKFSEYLRQLCCHPQLADETKLALSNCRTLQDIEKMMVAHYKQDVDFAQKKKTKVEKRIEKTEVNISLYLIQQKKQYVKKVAKKQGLIFQDSDNDEQSEEESEDDNEEKVVNYEEILTEAQNKLDAMVKRLKKVKKVTVNFNKMDKKKTVTLENMEESLDKLKLKLAEADTILKGKQTSYDFFTNVVDKLRKNVTKDSSKKSKYDNLDSSNIMDMYNNISSSDDEDDKDKDSDEDVDEECGICMDIIPEDDTGVTKCGHMFCYECLKMCVEKYHNCPYCKNALKDNEIFVLSFERKKKSQEMLPEQKQKEELINEIGTKLANLIVYLRETKERVIIFSQWDNLLRRVGRTLTDNKIKNVFCRGNCYQRDKAIREFNEGDKVKVIMLSSESTASGTNLTKATRVIFLDPIYGSYQFRKDQERQAIGRAHRMGQKSVVKVVRFIIKNSIEEDIYLMNKIEDEKHIDSKDYDELKEIEVDLNV